jgi:hypothetical protein
VKAAERRTTINRQQRDARVGSDSGWIGEDGSDSEWIGEGSGGGVLDGSDSEWIGEGSGGGVLDRLRKGEEAGDDRKKQKRRSRR